MNGQLPANLLTYPKINYRCPLLFGEGNQKIPEQKTIRIFATNLLKPKKEQSLLPTLRAEPKFFREHNTRFTPYQRPIKTKLDDSIIITKKTTITVNKAPSIFNREFYEQVLAAVNNESILVNEKRETPKVDIKEKN